MWHFIVKNRFVFPLLKVIYWFSFKCQTWSQAPEWNEIENISWQTLIYIGKHIVSLSKQYCIMIKPVIYTTLNNTAVTSTVKLPYPLWDTHSLKKPSWVWCEELLKQIRQCITSCNSSRLTATLLCQRRWGLWTSVVQNIGTARLYPSPPPPCVVLLSPLRTQPPFTSAIRLIRGLGPSVCQSVTQHVYKSSVYPFPPRLITPNGFNWRKARGSVTV